MLCEMNILATSDPEHHIVTAPSCLLSFIEISMATSSHCNTPEDLLIKNKKKNPQTSYKIKPVGQPQMMLPLPRFKPDVTI